MPELNDKPERKKHKKQKKQEPVEPVMHCTRDDLDPEAMSILEDVARNISERFGYKSYIV